MTDIILLLPFSSLINTIFTLDISETPGLHLFLNAHVISDYIHNCQVKVLQGHILICFHNDQKGMKATLHQAKKIIINLKNKCKYLNKENHIRLITQKKKEKTTKETAFINSYEMKAVNWASEDPIFQTMLQLYTQHFNVWLGKNTRISYRSIKKHDKVIMFNKDEKNVHVFFRNFF